MSRTNSSARSQCYVRRNAEGFPNAKIDDRIWPDDMSRQQMRELVSELTPGSKPGKLARIDEAVRLILADKELVELERDSGLVTPTQAIWTPPPGFVLFHENLEVGGFASGAAALETLGEKGIQLGGNARSVLSRQDFPILTKPQVWDIYRGDFGALGLDEYPCDWEDARWRSCQLGFDNLPPIAAVNLRFAHEEPQNQFTGYLLSKFVPVVGDDPHALYFKRADGGFWLGAHWIRPADRFDRECEILLGRRKS